MPDIYISSFSLGLTEITDFPPFLLDNFLKLETSSLCRFNPSVSFPKSLTNFHNYSPRPSYDFALNLASQDPETFSLSKSHVIDTILLSKKYNSSHYSFHSGFAIDLSPEMFGSAISGSIYNSRDDIFLNYCSNVKELGIFASSHGVRLLAENNVLGQTNFNRGYADALLCINSKEVINFLDFCAPYCGLLLDVAHLSVSSVSCGLSYHSEIKRLLPFIEGLHLSMNDFMEDTNEPFDSSAWFLPYLRHMPNLSFVTIEVKPVSFSKILAMVDLIKEACED